MENNTISSNSSNDDLIIMIDLKHIATVIWTQKEGDKLRELRGNTSRLALEKLTEDVGGLKVSHQYIQQLEEPETFRTRNRSGVLTVSMPVILSLCQALNTKINHFLNTTVITVHT